MNEIKKVHLGRQQFTIAIDAHKMLQEYLRAIEKQPGVQTEVVKEVELRMAELLIERGVTGDKVILAEDVDFLKGQLGEPRDFKDEETARGSDKDTSDTAEADAPKRLYRDTQNGMIAGVASGLAAYTGIDVILVRVLFVVLMLASGAGIIVYILLWILAPEAKTPSERLQMRGKAVTVDSLKEVVDRADIPGASRRASRGMVIIAESIAKVILAVVGAAFVTMGMPTIIFAIATGFYMLIRGVRLGSETIFPQTANETWLVVLGMTAIAIFGFFLVMIGIAMITRKWRLPSWLVAAILGVFFVAGGVATALGFDTYPQLRQRYWDSQHTQTRQLTAFKEVHLAGEDIAYKYVPRDTYGVDVYYIGNLEIHKLNTDVKDGVLTVNAGKLSDKMLCTGMCLFEYRQVEVVIYAPSIEKVRLTGKDNTFKSHEPLNQDSLVLETEDVRDGSVFVSHIDAANAELTGNGNRHTLALTGLKQGASEDMSVQLSLDEYAAYISPTERFRLNTGETCDEDEPLVYLYDVPAEVIINGQGVKGREALSAARTEGKRTDYNCVLIR